MLQGVLQNCSLQHKKESYQNSRKKEHNRPQCIGTNQNTPCIMFRTIMQGRLDSMSHSHWLSVPEQYSSSSPKMRRSWVSLTSWSPYIGSVCKGCITNSCPPLASSISTIDCSQMSYVRALGSNISSKANNGRAYVGTSSLAT